MSCSSGTMGLKCLYTAQFCKAHATLVGASAQLRVLWEDGAIASAFPLCNDFHYQDPAFRIHTWQNSFIKSRGKK